METFKIDYRPNPPSRPKGLVSFERHHRNLDAWESYFLKKTNEIPSCEICGKILKYFSGDRKESVHFDHKKINLPIKGIPSHWLASHKPISENISIWESCNFGILCRRCNLLLITENRRNWLEKAIQYINKN